MDKKYFFFDIDGTLLAWRKDWTCFIPDSTKQALEQLRENGHFIAIATGRSHAMALDTMKLLGINNIVHDGGNGITINGELIDITPLDFDLCLKLAEECDKKNIPWGVATGDTKYRLTKNDDFYKVTKDNYMDNIIVNDLDLNNYENIYKMFIACDSKQEKEIETLKKLPWCRYHESYLFVEPTDKSKGIIKMMEHLNADIKDVVVFGDDLNDLTMFVDKWICIAMGNAKQEVKDRASYITDDITEDGIYNACKHFGWI